MIKKRILPLESSLKIQSPARRCKIPWSRPQGSLLRFLIPPLGSGLLAVLLFLSFLFPTQSRGAACCARNSSTPSLIIGDDWSQFNFGYAYSSAIALAGESGQASYFPAEVQEGIQTYRLDAATLLSDRFQVGASLFLVNHRLTHSYISDSSTGIGDVRLSAGYEALPDWSYSIWKPQIYLFSSATIPTGRSLEQSQKSSYTDVTGNGFFSLSLGSLFIKRWVVWDAFLLSELHYSLPRTFENDAVEFKKFRVEPGWGGSLGVGLGMSPGGGALRLGLRVMPRYEQGKMNVGIDHKKDIGFIATCDVGADLGYLLTSQDTVMVAFTDQTLLGPSYNSNLNRVLAINFQHRWER